MPKRIGVAADHAGYQLKEQLLGCCAKPIMKSLILVILS
jgi:hypothetical protein